MLRRQFLIMLLCVAMTLLTFGLANATDYYVKAGTAGNDSNAGTAAAPWKTITRALSQDTGTWTPVIADGDTIYVLPGTYDTANGETFPLSILNQITLIGAGAPVLAKTVDASSSGKRVFQVVGIDNVKIAFLEICNGTANAIAPGNKGGGIYIDGCMDIEVADCEFHNNYASNSGGAIWVGRSSGKLHQNVIWENDADDNCGGGIYIWAPTNEDCSPQTGSNSPLVVRDNCLYDNTCGDSGAGVYFKSDDTQYYYADCQGYGGGDGTWFFNNLVFENAAGSDDAGGLQIGVDDDGRCAIVTVDNNTIAHNTYYGLYAEDHCCTDGKNNIIWGNGPADRDDVGSSEGHILNIIYSDIYTVATGAGSDYNTGNGNIDVDPLWTSLGVGGMPCDGYFLMHTSPCIDTGTGNANDADKYGEDPSWTNTRFYAETDRLDVNVVDMGHHYKKYGGSYIELASFSVDADFNKVVVKWETATEIDNAGFLVYRCDDEASGCHKVSDFISANGNAAGGATYSFTDTDVKAGETYYYYLVDIDTDGTWTAHGPTVATLPIRLDLAEPVRGLLVNQKPDAR
ncbi:MAG: right-handed parallel beta-helix repeat-containing protein [Candidatus Coatesbacteria bacterium]|nr:right-handed parallel beta-helix repeat-containing protein [Candidatus Coatesbacteria bacterium]